MKSLEDGNDAEIDRPDESRLCAGLRVLEFSVSIAAAYAGWLLSRMGAEVVSVERAEGAPLPTGCDRGQAAFARRFAHLDSGKSALGTGPATDGGLPLLLAECDVLLIDDEPAFEQLFGASLRSLRSRYPELIVGSSHLLAPINRFDAPATALQAQAEGGIVWAVGDPKRPPLPFPPGVLEHQGGSNLTAAVLLAVVARQRHGKGEHAAVALSQVLSYYACGNALGLLPWGLKWQRAGMRCFGSGGAYPYTLLPCKDGLVCLICRTRDEWGRLVAAMGNPAWAQDPRFQDLRAMGTKYPQEVDGLIRPWLAGKTREELLAISLEHSIPMAPVRDIAEVLATPQFAARASLETLVFPQAEAVAPGLPFQVSGQRSEQVRTARRFAAGPAGPFNGWRGARSARCPNPAIGDDSLPLAGIRVLDLGWVWSAPLVSGILSEFGAEVIKVEHSGRLDNMRMRGRPQLADGKPAQGPSIELSPAFHQINHNKRGITLDIKHPLGLQVLRRLAAQCDLVIENMSPGAAERAGLEYEALATANPRLIMVALSAVGQFGPSAAMRAYAPVMSSYTGLEGLVGYSGEAPVGAMNVGLGDPNAAAHALVAILAAISQRETTGRGCYVDLSQVECLLSTLAGPLIDGSLGAPQPLPLGATHPGMAPHGVYPAAGDDQWVALAVTDDAQWRRLGALMGAPGEALLALYPGSEQRLAHQREIDGALAQWTAASGRADLCQRLRDAGIAVSPVLSIEEVRRDPGFLWGDTLREVTHPVSGPETLIVSPWRFETIQAKIHSSSPTLGQHNAQVLCELGGLTEDSLQRLQDEGVVR